MSFIVSILFVAMVSMAGWLAESVMASVRVRRPVSRGLMFGPFLPFYGVGALLYLGMSTIAIFRNPLLNSIAITVALSFAIFSMEWLLKKIYHISLYKNKADGNKKIIFWGARGVYLYALCVFSSYVFMPLTQRFSQTYATGSQMVSSLLVILFLTEIILFLVRITKVRRGLAVLCEKPAIRESEGACEECSFALHDVYGLKSVFAAYPYLKLYDYVGAYEQVQQAQRPAVQETAKRFKDSLHTLFLTGNDLLENQNPHSFAHGLNAYKLFWVFLLGCVIGWFCEMVFCFVTNGYVESRQGLLYGPFSQVYGLGAVLLVVMLYRLRRSRDLWIFGFSMLIGGAFEWVCSYVQEMAFGTVSWDYTGATGSIGGRTSLLYMFFWGVLGCAFIKLIYPKLSSLIENIPNRIGKPLTWFFCLFLLLNATLTVSAVYRQSLRHDDIAPRNAYEVLLDEKYPDDFLSQIYPNMKPVENE